MANGAEAITHGSAHPQAGGVAHNSPSNDGDCCPTTKSESLLPRHGDAGVAHAPPHAASQQGQDTEQEGGIVGRSAIPANSSNEENGGDGMQNDGLALRNGERPHAQRRSHEAKHPKSWTPMEKALTRATDQDQGQDPENVDMPDSLASETVVLVPAPPCTPTGPALKYTPDQTETHPGPSLAAANTHGKDRNKGKMIIGFALTAAVLGIIVFIIAANVNANNKTEEAVPLTSQTGAVPLRSHAGLVTYGWVATPYEPLVCSVPFSCGAQPPRVRTVQCQEATTYSTVNTVARVAVVNESMCNTTQKPTLYDPCPTLSVGDSCDDGLHLTSNDVCAVDQSCVGKVHLASIATLHRSQRYHRISHQHNQYIQCSQTCLNTCRPCSRYKLKPHRCLTQ